MAVVTAGGKTARLQLDFLDGNALRELVREVKQTVRAGRLNLEIHLAAPLHVASEKAMARFVHFLDRMARLPGVRIRVTGLTDHMESLMLRVLPLVPAFEWVPGVSRGRKPDGRR
jgi:hypothetical protein